LIIGGSQGAHAINMAVIEALDYIENIDKIHFIHQTGEKDREIVKNTYEKQNVSCNVKSFFENMALLYNQVDLLICRAGATTIAEITSLGKAAVFIPFPFAADDHQKLNAQNLTKSGAADMIIEKELSPECLAKKINYYEANPETLKQMECNAKKHGRPKAAQRIVKDCYELITDN
ncbi:glycosyltransferase, partial [Desulfobacterales bacterium HSG17]|nr:glycosyltransferase [Desulfobacterales bacterium HSG17]